LDGRVSAHKVDGVRVVVGDDGVVGGVTKGKLLRKLQAGESLVEFVYDVDTDPVAARRDALAGGAGAVQISGLDIRLIDGREAARITKVGQAQHVEMSDNRLRKISTRLSWLLRHGAVESDMVMDPAGWVDLSDVVRELEVTDKEFSWVITHNNKARFEVKGDRVRACQGHSSTDTPVTLEALEASWRNVVPTMSLWHGTSAAALASVMEQGLRPQGRTHVHLAGRRESNVGKRARVDVLLEIDPQVLTRHGTSVFRAANGVLLAREVPVAAIVSVQGITPAGVEAADRY
jgi:putative RNA 2'-phosphotransferase